MYYLRCFLPWRTNTNMDRLVFSDTLTSRPSVPSSHLRICWTDWRTWCVTSWTVCSNLLPLSCSTTSTRFVAALGAKWRSHRLICEYILKFRFFILRTLNHQRGHLGGWTTARPLCGSKNMTSRRTTALTMSLERWGQNMTTDFWQINFLSW